MSRTVALRSQTPRKMDAQRDEGSPPGKERTEKRGAVLTLLFSPLPILIYIIIPQVLVPAAAFPVTMKPGNTSTSGDAQSDCTISFPQHSCDSSSPSKPVVCSWHNIKPKGYKDVEHLQLDCPELVEDELPVSNLDHPGFHYKAGASSCRSAIRLNKPTRLQRTLRIGCVCNDGLFRHLQCSFDVPAKGCGESSDVLLVERCDNSTHNRQNVTNNTTVTGLLSEPPPVSSHLVPSSSPPPRSSPEGGTYHASEGSSIGTGVIVVIAVSSIACGIVLGFVFVVSVWVVYTRKSQLRNQETGRKAQGSETWIKISKLPQFIPTEWKQLADQLGVQRHKQREVETNNPHHTVQAAEDILQFWYENIAKQDEAIYQLTGALNTCHLQDICEMWQEEVTRCTAPGSETTSPEERSTSGEASCEDRIE